jgi:MerR family redox-sensitive transcriptional activator SoxR
MNKLPDPLISIRDMAQRSGVAASTLRYYEKLGLIASEREGSSEHRRYRESIFHRIQYVTLAQRAGFSLEEILAQLVALPERLPPPKKQWQPLSKAWLKRIDERIAELEQLKVDIANCPGV